MTIKVLRKFTLRQVYKKGRELTRRACAVSKTYYTLFKVWVSRKPINCPNRAPNEIEDKVIEAKDKTGLGPKRLSLYLKKHEGAFVPPGTTRHILRRNKERLVSKLKSNKRRKGKREFIDWYSTKPFELVQMDIKFIRDQKAQ